MGSKASAPDPPDYSGVASASKKSARLAAQVSREQLAWAKEQYALDREVTDRVVGQALDINDTNAENAAADRARYEQLFQPLEQQLISEADSYASGDRVNYEAGRAEAEVAQQFQQARSSAERALQSYGIDPTSARYGALDIGTRSNQAAAAAGAGNTARAGAEATGRALRSEALNIGKGYPGQIAASYGTALQAGNQAVNAGLATTATGANTMGTPTQWQGLSNQAVGTWGNTLNQGYQNQLAQFSANQSASSGWGTALGLAGGLGMRLFGFAAGGAVPDDGDGDEESYLDFDIWDEGMDEVTQAGNQGQNDGQFVDPRLSPSGGSETDDVAARLNAGEFVIPKDVVEFKGEEFFHRLITKTKADRKKALDMSGAEPSSMPAGEEAPAFVSGGGRR